jgi:hypothetical protein
LGEAWELMVDRRLIARMRGSALKLAQPERREVALTFDVPWESPTAFPQSVVQDGAIVRLYYRACSPDPEDSSIQGSAMAVSHDGGLSFERPVLGRVKWNGCTENNLLAIGKPPLISPVFRDTNPDCRREERFKGISAHWRKAYAMGSPDGIEWRMLGDGPLNLSGTFDTVNTAFWDVSGNRYRSYTRFFYHLDENTVEANVLGPDATVVRAIQSSTSRDFLHWTRPLANRYRDRLGETQLYTNATVLCPDASRLYLAFPNRYVQHRMFKPEHGHPGVNDALFMSSRDGVTWSRFSEAWVRPGLDAHNWTDRNNYPVWGIVRTSPTEWSMYVSEHYRNKSVPGRMRRLSIRPHGFVSVHADVNGGGFLSRPMMFGPGDLRINLATSAAGWIRVGVIGADGTEIEGYGLNEMDEIYGDDLDRIIRWRGGKSLGSLAAGRACRLVVALGEADLYALRVA